MVGHWTSIGPKYSRSGIRTGTGSDRVGVGKKIAAVQVDYLTDL
jgi:hypothetical protein